MSQSLRQRRELHEVCAIGKPAPKLLTEGAVYHAADTHGDVARFMARQVARGLKPKEKQQ